jgi:LPXTG-site transpeptidase (sortase) family protein
VGDSLTGIRPKRAMKLRPSNRWLELGLILLGLVPVGVAFRACDQAYAFQSARVTPRGNVSGPAAPSVTAAPGSAMRLAPTPAAAKGVLGRIEIVRLGISAVIAEGTDVATLKGAVGHVLSTSQPGEAGNVGLAAHRDGLFRGLGGVRQNDIIRIVTPRGSYSYRVEYSVVVGPKRVDLLDSTAVPSLTLITCYPFHWIGHAPKRFVVRAVQFEPLARDSRRPTDVSIQRT